MQRIVRLTALCVLVSGAGFSAPPGPGLDGPLIERLTGLKGTLNEAEGVFKVTAPRTDLTIAVDEWTLPPFLGLTSWAAFQVGKAEAASDAQTHFDDLSVIDAK